MSSSNIIPVDPLRNHRGRVDSAGRRLSDSVTREDHKAALNRGYAFDVEINDIAVTVATETGILYLRNDTTDFNMFVPNLYLNMGSTTGGSGGDFVLFRVVKSPTGGTLLTAGSVLTPSNRRIGDPTTAPDLGSTSVSAGAFLGNKGNSTVTGGSTMFRQELGVGFPYGISPFGIDVMLAPGASVAFTFTAQAGNTSQVVHLGAQFHYELVDPFVSASL